MEVINAQQFEELSRLHARWISDFEEGITPTGGNQMRLASATIRGVALSGVSLRCASLNSCRIEDCSFVRCAFDSSELIDTMCVRCSFADCGFMKADLRGLNAPHCSFPRCDFTRADLTDAGLAFADCSRSTLDWAWLVRTDLRYARLDGVKIVRARIDHVKMFNTTRWKFTADAQDSDAEIDYSENGDGSVLIRWPEALCRLLETS